MIMIKERCQLHNYSKDVFCSSCNRTWQVFSPIIASLENAVVTQSNDSNHILGQSVK